MTGIPLRSLVVEDSGAMRRLLCELLGERGYEVTAMSCAEEALAAHRQAPFELMLVDWTLPGRSGLELCREVRRAPGGEDVYILVVTGRDKPEDLHAVLDAGASDYLPKPIDPTTLSTRLLIAERTLAKAEVLRAERASMESRLSFADRMASVGTLTAGVAHELNNPLMYVLSNLHLTREELEGDREAGWMDRAQQQLDEAIQGASRMQHIVRDLKTFARVDDEQRTNVDLRGVLESSINMCWNEIRHRSTLERELGDVPFVDANESRLGQVFLNLLVNALHALPDRPVSENRITVRTRTDSDGWAVAEVSDNGTGIEAERASRVFEPFFTTKGVSEGTGLGLAISRSIVQAAGGSIDLRTTLGKGTTLAVRLPPSKNVHDPAPTQLRPVPTGSGRATVVVIDDEPLVGRSIRRALRGHDVEVYTSGWDAIERLRSGAPFDIVFCDLMMPEVSGIEVYTRVVREVPDLSSRFVFMTGGAFTVTAREFLDTTPMLCLEKPFELRQVRELVAERVDA